MASAAFEINTDIVANLVPVDVVFMHGNLASNTWWEPAVGVWKKNPVGASPRGQLILGEWRGCGKSPAPASASELHPSVLADDYIRKLKALDAGKVDIVAHSTGGLIALYAILKAPELFGRAVLLDPVGVKGVQFDQNALDGFTQMSQNREVCAAVMSATIHGNDPTSALFQRIVDDTMGIANMNWLGVPQALRDIDLTKQVEKIENKVLVLHGELDPILPIEASRDLANLLPNGEFRLLNGQGHSTNVENPELFVQIVNDFLFR